MNYVFEYATRHISGPTPDPVTIAEIEKHLKLDTGSAYDPDDLMRKARAARRAAEGVLGQLIGTQVWDIICDCWPSWNWRIPLEPVQSIEGIYFTDADGTATPVDSAIYALAGNRILLTPSSYWPSFYLQEFAAVRIRLVVGIDPVPEHIKQAILLRTGTLDQVREDVTLGTTLQAKSVGTFEALLGVDRNIGV